MNKFNIRQRGFAVSGLAVTNIEIYKIELCQGRILYHAYPCDSPDDPPNPGSGEHFWEEQIFTTKEELEIKIAKDKLQKLEKDAEKVLAEVEQARKELTALLPDRRGAIADAKAKREGNG